LQRKKGEAHGQCGVETKIEMLQNPQTQFLKKKKKGKKESSNQ